MKLKDEDAALAHNGDIVNFDRVRRRLQAQGVEFLGSADSETMAAMISLEYSRTRDLEQAIRRARQELIGGYSVVMVAGHRVVAFRDPLGIRPLVLGELHGGYCVASESVAVELMGGRLLRDVAPGEILTIDRNGTLTSNPGNTSGQTAHCMFEWVYFSRPDSIVEGKSVYSSRTRIGERLAREAPVEADLVVPVPDSSRPQALGFSQVSGIPYAEGLIKNRFVERTFILTDQKRREEEVRVKLHPVPGIIKGKRVVLVDDSIVRGTTLREIVAMVRNAGAIRIDVRIGCPPIMAPCYFGIDMKTRRELVAYGRTPEEIAQIVGADSVHYLSLEGLIDSLGLPQERLCVGCLTGRYPLEVPEERQRFQKSLAEF
jgi:amidophosphoribosyltransferase